jgi:hypothetical protein
MEFVWINQVDYMIKGILNGIMWLKPIANDKLPFGDDFQTWQWNSLIYR